MREIHAFIATHPDPDHIGAVPELFAEFNVLVVYHSGFVKTTQAYYDFIDSLQEEGCAVYDGDDFGPGEILPISSKVKFKVLSIDPLAEDSNDASIVLKVSYGNFDMILEGDASWKKESYMIHHYGNELDTEVLKVSHHGSISASSYEWLEATTPDVAVICVGPNDYGLPNPIVLDRLQRNCNSVLITDEEGCIMISSDGNNYEICSINL